MEQIFWLLIIHSDRLVMRKILVTQLTGRMHYGAARAFNGANSLSGLVTDFFVPHKIRAAADFFPPLTRYTIDLPKNLIYGNPVVGLKYRFDLKYYPRRSALPHIRASRSLARLSERYLAKNYADTVFSFDIQALETFLNVGCGRFLVLEQCVAPRSTQLELLNFFVSQGENIDGLEFQKKQLEILSLRERAEWELADMIVAPSEYVVEELIKCGVDAKKIKLVPYGFNSGDQGRQRLEPEDNACEELSLIFVGAISYRKGFHTLMSALEEAGINFRLDVFGPQVDDITVPASISPSVFFHGAVPFEKVAHSMRRSDFIVLPSFLEGSATVIYEALSFGLPAIVTKQVGSVISNKEDGFVLKGNSSGELALLFRELSSSREEFDLLKANAFMTSKKFSQNEYARRLCEAVLS